MACSYTNKLSFRQAKQLNTERSWNKYNKARNKVTSALRSAKKAFLNNLSRDVKTPRDFWAAYNRLSPNCHRVPETLTYQSETTRSSFGKSDLLNRFLFHVLAPVHLCKTNNLLTVPLALASPASHVLRKMSSTFCPLARPRLLVDPMAFSVQCCMA